MRINHDHMYHGAALTQIAEHPQFTAINAFSKGSQKSRCGFRVNDDIGIYLKYASEKTKAFGEYPFTFLEQHLQEVEALSAKTEKVFIVFVCVKAKEICCIPHGEFQDLIAERKKAKGQTERTYTVLVTCANGKSFRVYMNVPGRKKKTLRQRVIPRNRFPGAIFA